MQQYRMLVLVWLAIVGVILVLVFGCTKEAPLPPVAPPPEDLSTWAAPELVQVPPEASPVPDEPPAVEKPTAAEKVYPYTPGTTFTVQVVPNAPLDLVLEGGEQVRNIVGGDRSPSEPLALAQGEVRASVQGEAPTQGKDW